MKTIYTLAIVLMSGVILAACVGAVNIGGVSPEYALINRCIVGNTAQADPTCAKAVADTNGCINNPFSSGCEANPLFSPHVQNARDERVKFCNNADNENDSLCRGDDTITDICDHNPFSRFCSYLYNDDREATCRDEPNSERCMDTVIRICDGDEFDGFCDGHAVYKNLRIADCIIGNNVLEERCAKLLNNDSCIKNPFADFCETNIDFMPHIETAQSNRIALCGLHENKNESICSVVLERPNAASWQQSFEKELFINGRIIGNRNNHFVKGLRKEGHAGRYLTLDSFDLGGDSTDGVVFFSHANIYYSYAGVLDSTNLGLPLNEKSGVAEWSGRFQSTGKARNFRSPSKYSVSKDFTLTINFGAGEHAGSITASILAVDTDYYEFNGYFDDKGVIKGNINLYIDGIYGFNPLTGRLSGLIGQEGAVGAFISDGNHYVGGFVARPPSE